MHGFKEGRRRGVYLVDRLFQRPFIYIGGHEDGDKGDHSVPDSDGSAVFVLYRGVSRFALVPLYVSADPLEPDEDSSLSFAPGSRDTAGMLCKSSDYADVHTYLIRACAYRRRTVSADAANGYRIADVAAQIQDTE